MPATQSHAIDLQPMDVPAFDLLLKQTKAKQQILVVDFWGTWCGPCVELFGPMHEALAPLADSGHVQVATIAWAFEEDLKEEKAFLKAQREASQQSQPDAPHTPSRDYFLSFDADADDLYAHVSPRIAANPAFPVAYPMVFVIDPVTNQTLEFHGDDQPITPEAVVAATKRLLAKRGL